MRGGRAGRSENKFVLVLNAACMHVVLHYVSFSHISVLLKTLKNMGLGSVIRDLGSGKNLFRIPDPGVKKAPDLGSATLIFPRKYRQRG
jgi:hypothetical protein